MRIGILGTGVVGHTLGSKLVSLGHEVKLGSRSATNEKADAWVVEPSKVPGDHVIFVCGNDAAAKRQVTDILKKWFGWKNVIDLGDISNARGTEMMLALWIRLMGHFKSPNFNFVIARGS